jgi:hypothetical protein
MGTSMFEESLLLGLANLTALGDGVNADANRSHLDPRNLADK